MYTRAQKNILRALSLVVGILAIWTVYPYAMHVFDEPTFRKELNTEETKNIQTAEQVSVSIMGIWKSPDGGLTREFTAETMVDTLGVNRMEHPYAFVSGTLIQHISSSVTPEGIYLRVNSDSGNEYFSVSSTTTTLDLTPVLGGATQKFVR